MKPLALGFILGTLIFLGLMAISQHKKIERIQRVMLQQGEIIFWLASQHGYRGEE